MRNVEFENILDTCIAEIRSGQATVEKCLQRYPDHAPALEPLLHEAMHLIMLPSVTMPDEVVDAVGQRMLNRAAEIRATISQKERSVRRSFWSRLAGRRTRLLPMALSLVLALVITGTWIVSVSASSLPGEVLYPVKLVTERMRLTVAFRHEARAQLHLDFAERRLVEMQALLAEKGVVEKGLLDALAVEMTLALEEMEKVGANQKTCLAAKLLALTERQQAVLTSVQEHVPAEAQTSLNWALEVSQRGHEQAIMALGITPEPSTTPSASLTHTPHATPTGTLTPTQTSDLTETLEPTVTPKPTETPESTETPKPVEMSEPTQTPESTETPEPTDAPTETPTSTPTPDEWDRSSLYFDEDYSCQGDCEEIRARVCNGGEDMAGPSTWQLYWAASGNPKNGTLIASGTINPLTAGECQILIYNPSDNPNGDSGNYMFKAYQRPGHQGTGELWSETCEITCEVPPTETPVPTQTPAPTETPEPTETPTETPTSTPTPDEWDRSSLYFDEDYSCQGDCEEIRARVCNGGEDMAGPSTWQLYWAASGNPKKGDLIASGTINPLAAGECRILTYTPSDNPNGASGSYMFKAYQRPGHQGTGELWSEACEITCEVPPT